MACLALLVLPYVLHSSCCFLTVSKTYSFHYYCTKVVSNQGDQGPWGQLTYPQGVLKKTHENVGLLVKCTSGVLRAKLNSVGGTVAEKGWEPLLYKIPSMQCRNQLCTSCITTQSQLYTFSKTYEQIQNCLTVSSMFYFCAIIAKSGISTFVN